jgi:hypothetical protein
MYSQHSRLDAVSDFFMRNGLNGIKNTVKEYRNEKSDNAPKFSAELPALLVSGLKRRGGCVNE